MRCDLEEVSPGQPFSSEVCIVGGGVAGIILAHRLAESGIDVHLLEAGGLELEERSQELYQASLVGRAFGGLTAGRFRVFGGSSTRWAAQLLPYPPETLLPRPAVGDLGWPVTAEEIAPFAEEIPSFMRVNDQPFDARFWRAHPGYPLEGRDGVRVRFSKWAPLGRRNLAWTLGRECLASPRATVFLHANAIAFALNPEGDAVTGLTVRNYRGQTFPFTARHYVVAAGTIETSRLLLNSPGVNRHDQVGRYFFDHVSCPVGSVGGDAYPPYCRYFAPYFRRNTLHTPRMETSEQLQREHNCLAVMAHFEFEEPEGSGLVIFRRFLHDLQRGQLGRGQKFSDLPMALLGGARTVFDLKVRGRRIPSRKARLNLHFDVEQRPDADSRLYLTDEPDAVGMPRLAMDWRRSAEEARAMYLFTSPMDTFLRSFGLQLAWRPNLCESAQAWEREGGDIYHPMGGARMGTDPARSVVDPNLGVHGLENLHVASCAVYPTGGSSNPTYTLMALSLRLARQLTARLRGQT
jgi:choline dehydrogenase-like flavoprotein